MENMTSVYKIKKAETSISNFTDSKKKKNRLDTYIYKHTHTVYFHV